MTKLRFMTYNLGWLQGEGSEGVDYKKRSKLHFSSSISAVANNINENKIDIVGFQEIDFHSKKSQYIDQFEQIKIKTKMRGSSIVCWDEVFLPFPYTNPWGRVKSGGAVIANRDLSLVENVLFESPKNMFFLKRLFYLKRYIQVLSINVNGKEEFILNMHLEAFDFQAKTEQLIVLKRLIEKYNPIVVMGDMNTIPKGYNLKVDIDYSLDPNVEILPMIMSSYKDIFEDKLTFPTWQPNCRLDYIWVKKEIPCAVVELKYLFNPSDHEPLALEITL